MTRSQGSWAPLIAASSILFGFLHIASASSDFAQTIAADRLSLTTEFDWLNGSGIQVGLWDSGAVRTSHHEFNSRAWLMQDSPFFDNHATHGAGIIAASGLRPEATGIAPAAEILSFVNINDLFEMQLFGAQYPGHPGKLTIANASYGFNRGWNYIGGGTPWAFLVADAFFQRQLEDPAFGQYNQNAHDIDSVATQNPYLLIFKPSGNDRVDEPDPGDRVYLSTGHRNSNTVSIYNPNDPLHPKGDGSYFSGGYGTISDAAIAKNIITVGGIYPLSRNTSGSPIFNEAMSEGSSWGPVDSGRIKPDLVAQSIDILSTGFANDLAYSTMTGTSQASASAAGAAALVHHAWQELFPGSFIRASTVKALLIHHADDLGTTGPDYRYGWGVINIHDTVRHIRQHSLNPRADTIKEDQLSTTKTTTEYIFSHSATEPFRVTLVWTDPPAPPTQDKNRHTTDIIHQLDLTVTDPQGTVHFPYVMPFALNDTNSPTLAAVRSQNDKDVVEQVEINAPTSGSYTVRINWRNATESSGTQAFSLIVSTSGVRTNVPSPSVSSPTAGFPLGTTWSLHNGAGEWDPIPGLEVFDESIHFLQPDEILYPGIYRSLFHYPGSRNGPSRSVIKIPATEPDALAEITWDASFPSSWSAADHTGNTGTWQTMPDPSGTGDYIMRATSPTGLGTSAMTSDLTLTSPPFPTGTGLDADLTFEHSYNINFHSDTAWDGAVLEVSLDGSPFADITTLGLLIENPYRFPIATGYRNPLATRPAWAGTSNDWTFVRARLPASVLENSSSVAFRWRLGTDEFTSSQWSLRNINWIRWKPASRVQSIIPNANYLSEDLWQHPLIGSGSDAHWPWLYTSSLGWLFIAPIEDPTHGAWAWSPHHQWLWLRADMDFHYNFNSQIWFPYIP